MGVLTPHDTAGRWGNQEEAEDTDHGPLVPGSDCPGAASRDSGGSRLGSGSGMLQLAPPPHSPEVQHECATLEPEGRDEPFSSGSPKGSQRSSNFPGI